jgi:hypothetical protein
MEHEGFYSSHKSPPLVHVLCQINPIHLTFNFNVIFETNKPAK